MAATATQSPMGKRTAPETEGKYLTLALAHEGHGLEIVEICDTK